MEFSLNWILICFRHFSKYKNRRDVEGPWSPGVQAGPPSHGPLGGQNPHNLPPNARPARPLVRAAPVLQSVSDEKEEVREPQRCKKEDLEEKEVWWKGRERRSVSEKKEATSLPAAATASKLLKRRSTRLMFILLSSPQSQAQMPSWDRAPAVSPADMRADVFTARPSRSQSFRDPPLKGQERSGTWLGLGVFSLLTCVVCVSPLALRRPPVWAGAAASQLNVLSAGSAGPRPLIPRPAPPLRWVPQHFMFQSCCRCLP